jgi:uncharacterized protein (TIGR03437 family)
MRAAWLLALCGAVASAGRLPVVFEPNRGQAESGADFVARVPGYRVTLSATHAQWTARGARVTAELAGAQRNVRGRGEKPLAGVVSYMRGQDASHWVRNVPTFEGVRYAGVYAGIDVVYYAKDGRLEYDFDVAPHADPRQIRLRFEGARNLRLDGTGDLVIETAAGELRQHRPVIYQEVEGQRRAVEGKYVLRGRTARLELARYDRSRPLVVDPVLTWATYFGGSYTDSGESVALDSSGNIYVTGTTLSSYGDFDVYFAKLNPAGTSAIFTQVIGGSYDDYGHGIAVDSGGNIYLAGETTSPDFPETNNSYPYLSANAYPGYPDDAYITKIDSTGNNIIYSHYFGGYADDGAYSIALDANNNAYVVGYTGSTDLPVSTGAAQTRSGGGYDAFVVEFNASGNGVYATYLGGSGDDAGYGLAVDAAGNAYVTGETSSTNYPVSSSAFQAKSGGGVDGFLTKLAPGTGTVAFSTYLGGSGNDYGYAVALDSAGKVYVAGETASSDFPIAGAAQKTFGGGAGDAFITKLSGDGTSLIYSTYLGGSGEDYAGGLAVDASGSAYITGGTASTNFPVTSDAFQKTNLGSTNALVAGLDATGSNLLFSSYLGGDGGAATNGTDYGNAVAVNCAAGLVAVGNTSSKNFPVTSGVVDGTYQGGDRDAFVAKIAAGGGTPVISPGGVVNNATYSATAVAPGSLLAVFGSGLATATQQPPGLQWPTNLAGATISVNNTPAPIYFASPGQVNIQLPYEAGVGTAVAMANGACGTSAPVTFQVAAAAPYIFQTASGDGIVQNIVTGQLPTLNSAQNPAKAGGVITVYLTGIGALDNPVATGAVAPTTPLSRPSQSYSSTVGGKDVTVYFLGLTPGFIGLAQANLSVPALSAGAYAVVITVGGVKSNGPNVYVTP